VGSVRVGWAASPRRRAAAPPRRRAAAPPCRAEPRRAAPRRPALLPCGASPIRRDNPALALRVASELPC